jgi:transposase
LGGLAREFKHPGVNLMVLWEEYQQAQPDGYGYSRFCDLLARVQAAALARDARASRSRR